MTPVRVLASDDDEQFASVYQSLQMAGGRKGLFESRNQFVMTVLLQNEGLFQVTMSRKTVGSCTSL